MLKRYRTYIFYGDMWHESGHTKKSMELFTLILRRRWIGCILDFFYLNNFMLLYSYVLLTGINNKWREYFSWGGGIKHASQPFIFVSKSASAHQDVYKNWNYWHQWNIFWSESLVYILNYTSNKINSIYFLCTSQIFMLNGKVLRKLFKLRLIIFVPLCFIGILFTLSMLSFINCSGIPICCNIYFHQG